MADLGDTHAGGGVGTGEWAAGAGANWSGSGDFGSVSNPGYSGGWGWSNGGAPAGGGFLSGMFSTAGNMFGYGLPWNDPRYNVDPLTGQAYIGSLYSPEAIAAGQSPARPDPVPVAGTPRADLPSPNATPMMGMMPPSFAQPIAFGDLEFTALDPLASIQSFAPASLAQLGLLEDSYPSISSFSPVMPNLSSPLYDAIEIQDGPPESYNERDARTVAGVAYNENRGNGMLGMQSVMNAGNNRAIADFSGRGYGIAREMTAPGQFAAPYTGRMDPMLMDMAGLAVQGQLPDLVNGYQSFRADRPGAGSSYHDKMEPLGSMAFMGHVFSDQPYELAGLPPERPAEFGPSYALGPALMDEQSFANVSVPGLAAPSYEESGKIAGRLRDESYQPTEAEVMAAARAELTDRMNQRADDVARSQGTIAYNSYPESYRDFYSNPVMAAYNQPAAAPVDVPAAIETMVAQAQPAAAPQGYGGFLSSFSPISAAQAAARPSARADFSPAPLEGVPGPYDRSVTPGASSGFGVSVPGWSADRFTSPAPATRDIVAAGRGRAPAEAPAAPAPAAAPSRSAPAPAAPAAAPAPEVDYMAGYYVDPLTGKAYGTPPAQESSAWQTAAKYGLPILGGLAGGPIGALAGAGLGWLAGRVDGSSFGSGAAGSGGADPYGAMNYAGGGQGDGVTNAVGWQGQGAANAATAAAATPVAPPPPKTTVRERQIHMPLRNDWLYLDRTV